MRKTIDESASIDAGSFSVTIKAEPLVVDTEVETLSAAPAAAIAATIAAGIRRAGVASPSTIARRKAKGISDTRRWNATGRLAASIRAEREGNSYVVVTASDRLQDDGMVEKLAADVPELDNPVSADVDAAIEDAVDAMLSGR